MVFPFLKKRSNKDSGKKSIEGTLLDKNSTPPLEAVVGLNEEGEAVTYDLATAPHLLTAGNENSGVQEGINAMYLSMMEHNSPDNLRLIVIDTKVTNFTSYNGSPFMYSDVVTDPKKALKAFHELVEETEARRKLFDKLRVRNIEAYNNKVSSDKRKPRLLLFVNEIAELMQTHGEEIEEAMSRLGEKARSVGIIVHVNTYLPKADVIKGKLRANLPSKIAYKLNSQLESDLVLDEVGAEELNGKGDAYIKWADSDKLIRVQSVYLSNDETDSILDSIFDKYPDKKYYNRIKF